MKKILFSLLAGIVALAAVFTFNGCSVNASSNQNTLKIADCGLLSPVTFFDSNNKLTGIGPDLGKMFASEQNQTAKFDIYDFPSMLAAVSSGKADLLMNATPTPERAQSLDFTKPYVTTTTMFVARMGDARLDDCTTPEQINSLLDGKKIGTIPGSSDDDYVKTIPGAVSVNFENIALMIIALKNSQVDFLLYDFLVTGNGVQSDIFIKNTDIKLINVAVEAADIACAVKKGNADLLNKLNIFIDETKTSGKLDEVIAKYV